LQVNGELLPGTPTTQHAANTDSHFLLFLCDGNDVAPRLALEAYTTVTAQDFFTLIAIMGTAKPSRASFETANSIQRWFFKRYICAIL
jgi:hypothetical protein